MDTSSDGQESVDELLEELELRWKARDRRQRDEVIAILQRAIDTINAQETQFPGVSDYNGEVTEE